MADENQAETSESDSLGAAEHLLKLCETLRKRGGFDIPARFGCRPEDLKIFRAHYSVPLPGDLADFLIRTLPQGNLDIGVYKTRSPKNLLVEQLEYLPFYPNLENHLFGLGWWTGQGDGDGWMYDLVDGGIYAVSHGDSYDHTRESLIGQAYLKFAEFESWIDFLEQECGRRGWLQP